MNMFGERIRKLREQHNHTQEDLAAYLGVSRATVSNYETEEREPDFSMITKISSLYNVSTDYIIGLTNIRNIDERVLLRSLENQFTNYNPDTLNIIETICTIINKHPAPVKLNKLSNILKNINELL